MKPKRPRSNAKSSAANARRHRPKTALSGPGGLPRAASDASPIQLKVILVPIDFSAPSRKALDYAVPLAKRFGAKLTLVHVVEPMAAPDFAGSFPLMIEHDRLAAACASELESLVKQRRIDPKLISQTIFCRGRSYHEITSTARAVKADLIIKIGRATV